MIDSDTLGRYTTFWEAEVEMRDRTIKSLRDDIRIYNEVIAGLRSGELPWDRVQIMETGQLKVIAPPPLPVPDTCDKGASEKLGKNGTKKLVEVAADGD